MSDSIKRSTLCVNLTYHMDIEDDVFRRCEVGDASGDYRKRGAEEQADRREFSFIVLKLFLLFKFT